MKLISVLLGIFLLSFTFLSCKNNKLTREKAAEIISKNFPRKVYNQFCIGKFSSGLGFRNQTVKDLQTEGLINLSQQNGEVYGFGLFQLVHYEITVPDNLKQYIGEIYKATSSLSYCGEGINDDKTMCLVKIGEQSFVGITGIHEISEQEVEVEYSWTFTNSTPFAKVFKSYILFNDDHRGMSTRYYYNSKVVKSEKVRMQKFDDGWRLSSEFNYPIMYSQANDPADDYPPVPTSSNNNQPQSNTNSQSQQETSQQPQPPTANSEQFQPGNYVVDGSDNRKIYFYNSPDVTTRRKAYFSTVETVYVQRVQNGYGYIEFTNANGKTSTGWLDMVELKKQ